MTTFARRERAALCNTLRAVGPDAPTLCTGWTARDLAAHLVVREHAPIGSLGIWVDPSPATPSGSRPSSPPSRGSGWSSRSPPRRPLAPGPVRQAGRAGLRRRRDVRPPRGPPPRRRHRPAARAQPRGRAGALAGADRHRQAGLPQEQVGIVVDVPGHDAVQLHQRGDRNVTLRGVPASARSHAPP